MCLFHVLICFIYLLKLKWKRDAEGNVDFQTEVSVLQNLLIGT